jgi:hypothetical protein
MYPPAIAEELRALGFDVSAVASDRELTGSDDTAVLGVAAAEHRCLVTENVQDFAVLARSADHAGLLFVNGRVWPRDRKNRHRRTAALRQLLDDRQLPGAGQTGWLH